MLLLMLLVPFLTGLLCWRVRSRPWCERLNLLAFVAVTVLAGRLCLTVAKQGPVEALGGFLRADALSALVAGLVSLVSLLCSVYAVGYFRQDVADGKISEKQLRRYYVFTPLFVSAMLLVPLADSLGIMWVAAEATTLASVLLVAFYNQKSSLEAAWKYIIIGSVGVSLALFGTILTYYSAVGVPGVDPGKGMNWSVLIRVAGQLNPDAMKLAFVLALLGYGTKAGLVPMHTWKPDAYAEAPVPAAALLGAGFINCAIYAILRFNALGQSCLGHAYTGKLLVAFGLASILLAAPFVLVQRNFRRLLAYSSIDHAGIMVAAAGFGGKLGALGAVLHLLYHALSKPLMFFCAGQVQQRFGTPYLRKVTGVIRVMPWTGGLFLIATMAITGVPPFCLFQSEFITLSAAMEGGRTWAAGLFVLGVVVIFCGFLIHMARLNLGKAPDPAPAGKECPWKSGAMLLTAAVMTVPVFRMPGPLYDLLLQAAEIVGGLT